MVILGCLHQIPLCWRQQCRMSRFSDSLEIIDKGDERLKRINGAGMGLVGCEIPTQIQYI